MDTNEITTTAAAVATEEVASTPVEVAAPEVVVAAPVVVKQPRKGGKAIGAAPAKVAANGKASGKVAAAPANGKVAKKDAPAAPIKPLAALSDKVAPKVIANKVAGSLVKQGEAHYVKVGDKTYRIAAQPAPIVGFNPKTASPRQKRVQAQASWPLAQWQRYCIGKHEAKARRNAK